MRDTGLGLSLFSLSLLSLSLFNIKKYWQQFFKVYSNRILIHIILYFFHYVKLLCVFYLLTYVIFRRSSSLSKNVRARSVLSNPTAPPHSSTISSMQTLMSPSASVNLQRPPTSTSFHSPLNLSIGSINGGESGSINTLISLNGQRNTKLPTSPSVIQNSSMLQNSSMALNSSMNLNSMISPMNSLLKRSQTPERSAKPPLAPLRSTPSAPAGSSLLFPKSRGLVAAKRWV